MIEEERIRGVLTHILGRSFIFKQIQAEIDTFFAKYEAARWLALSQAATIHEILMSKDLKNQLKRYKERQLKRASERDKWQKEVDGEKAIDYFYEIIEGFSGHSAKYNLLIAEITGAIEEDFSLSIPETSRPLIYQSLLKTFDYIFITRLRIAKHGGV